MIKSNYFKEGKHYIHEYYCDQCFKRIFFGEILRSEAAIENYKFDLCRKCKEEWDRFGELEEEVKGNKDEY